MSVVLSMLGFMDVGAGAWMSVVFPVVLLLLVVGWAWMLRARVR